MRMQELADPLAEVDLEDDSTATKEKLEKLTRLADPNQLSNYLSFGKWDLGMSDIERLEKDDQMRQRVSTLLFFPPTLLTLVLTNTFCLFACTANQRNNRRQDPKVDDPTQGLVAGNEGKFFDVFAPAPKKIPDHCPFAVVALSFESLTYHVYNFTPF